MLCRTKVPLGRAVASFGDQLSPQRYAEIVIAGLRAQPAG
jgi:hypothetical protein